MAESQTHIAPLRQGGFTLTEMLVALGILVFGLTTLLGSLTEGVGERRGVEMRLKAVHMVDEVLRDLQQNYIPSYPLDGGPLPAIGAGEGAEPPTLPGYPGMRYSVTFKPDPEHPAVVLCRIGIAWMAQGEAVAAVFDRILVREVPFSQRIQKLKENR